jgi:hypothetical protein
VRFSVSDVLFGEDKAITASGGAGSVALDERALSAALERAGAPFSLRLREAGAVVELPSGDEVAASIDVSKRALSIAPEGGLAAVSVTLPPILENVTYELAVTHDDYVTILLRLGPTTLRALQSGN